jgi:ribosomal protein S18 acetylase RimI-like enzyme
MRYRTNYYYDVEIVEAASGFSFSLVKKRFDSEKEKSFDDRLIEEWLENPQLFGAIENGKIIGYLELSHERWNNRMRISNILVEEGYRGRGIGKMLMNTAYKTAVEEKARMLILETQSCNEKAIAFYLSCGFTVVGFDLYAYSNYDVENREFRIELGKKVHPEDE